MPTLSSSWTDLDGTKKWTTLVVNDFTHHTVTPRLPLVMLLHGMGGDINHMSNPTVSPGVTFNQNDPLPPDVLDRGWHTYPNVGFWSIGLDGLIQMEGLEPAFNRLGYATCNYAQVDPNGSLARPVIELEAAVRRVLSATGKRIVFVCHSRGGLLLRSFLQRVRNDVALLRQLSGAVTLHTPHQGSQVAEVAGGVHNTIAVLEIFFPGLAYLALDWVDQMATRPAIAEMLPNGTFLTSLRAAETTPLPVAVPIHTFGGTTPRLTKLRFSMFDFWSAIPAWHWPPYHWTTLQSTLGLGDETVLSLISPEETLGGDVLVTDSRSHLPGEASHRSNPLNHAAALWDSAIKSQVDTVTKGCLNGTFDLGKVALTRNQDSRLEAAARAGDGSVWHAWQTSVNGPWSLWSSLSGTLASPPVLAANQDGRVELFARGPANSIWHTWQVAPNQTAPVGGWAAWASLGGALSGTPCVVANQDGRLEVFARGPGNSIWHTWQLAPNQAAPGAGWAAWASLGGTLTGNPAAVRNQNGCLEVFARGTDRAVWHTKQISPGGTWSGWTSIGGSLIADPVPVVNLDGRVEVFGPGDNLAIVHAWQLATGGTWSAWSSIYPTNSPTVGSVQGSPSPVVGLDGRIEVFCRGSDNIVYRQQQLTAGGASWPGWSPLPPPIGPIPPPPGWPGWNQVPGTTAGDVKAAACPNGRVELFWPGADLRVYRQTMSPAGTWPGWSVIV